jgi:predicted nucleic acid-binding protein
MGMTHVFWDTNLYIYLLEKNSPFRPPVYTLRQKMLAAQISLVTSTMTLGEVITGPRIMGDEALAAQYRNLLTKTSTIVPFEEKAADLYATIRAQHRVKQPDAIQLASAATHGVELFITNDDKLWKLRVPGIHFIVSIETATGLIA